MFLSMIVLQLIASFKKRQEIFIIVDILYSTLCQLCPSIFSRMYSTRKLIQEYGVSHGSLNFLLMSLRQREVNISVCPNRGNKEVCD